MVFNLRTSSFSSSGRSEEPEVVQSDLIEEPLSLRSALLRLNGRRRSEKDWFLVCPFVSDSDVDDTDLLELGDWLSWKRVALGVARGLALLQGKSRFPIQSILLICAGNEFMAIPGVFGSFKGYPQLHGGGDVHGYGVMLLQLMTGEEPSFLLELITHDGMNPKCCAAMITLRSPRNYIKEEGEQLAQLAFCCAVNYPDRVASMSEVVKTLEQVVCSGDRQKSKGCGSTSGYSLYVRRLLLGETDI
ncbi:hypothetical protein NL676_001627 [Syzygium grande]|nr:hypothetical protein NL676_001627 [Syzygium grande]